MRCNNIMSTYLLSLKNEIYIDDIAFIQTGLSKIIDYNVIRPQHTHHHIKNHPKAFRFLLIFLSSSWILWNSIIQTILLLKHLSNAALVKRKIISSEAIILVATHRLPDQLKKVMDTVPSQALMIGKGTSSTINCASANLIDVVNIKDIFNAYYYSLLAPINLRKYIRGNYIIQTYNSFEWFLINCFLTRQKGIKEIWFANHFDRWAILFDNLKIERKIIVQHGIENGKLIPPVMLKSITKAYLIKADQKPFFVGKIIENDFEFEELKSEIKLTEIFCQDKLRVLIVGNASIHSVEERFLIQHLSSLNIHFCLKPHPVLSQNFYTELKQDTDFLLIADKNTFPEVDVVISYESTLGLEYELEGVKVLYYADNTVDEIIQYLKRSIKE